MTVKEKATVPNPSVDANGEQLYWYTKFVTHRTINMIYNNIYYPRRTE